MEKSRAIELLRLAVPIKALTQQEYADFVEAVNMGMDALKAQLSSEGTTSDLISRTETVERLRGVLDVTVPITDYDGGYVNGVEAGISTVSTMPTIQPQSTTGQLNDGARSTNLIDRQAAIDGKISIQRANGVEIYSDEAVPVEYLKRLPTIRPEPHEGHWINGKCDLCGEHAPFWAMASTYHESKYCPNCGAKMKGGAG